MGLVSATPPAAPLPSTSLPSSTSPPPAPGSSPPTSPRSFPAAEPTKAYPAIRRASRGRTILIVTHRLAPLMICDRVALLIGGRIERIGPPAEVIAFTRARMGQANPPVPR